MTKIHREIPRLALLFALGLLTLWVLPADAQEEPIPTVTLNLQNVDLQEVLEQISEATEITILAESTATGKTNVNLKDQPLEEALTSICKPFHLEWRKLYLALDPQAPTMPSGDKLAQTLRALSQLPVDGLVAPQSKANTILCAYRVRQKSKSEEGLKLPENYQMVYLITNPHRPSQLMMMDEATRQRFLEQWQQMPPQQQISSMFQDMNFRLQLLNSLDPQSRTQLLQQGAMAFTMLPPQHQRQMVWSALQMASMIDPAVLRKWMREYFRSR